MARKLLFLSFFIVGEATKLKRIKLKATLKRTSASSSMNEGAAS